MEQTCCWLSMESSSLVSLSGSCAWLLFCVDARELSGPKMESCPSIEMALNDEENQLLTTHQKTDFTLKNIHPDRSGNMKVPSAGAPAAASETAQGSAAVAAQPADGRESCWWALTPWAWKEAAVRLERWMQLSLWTFSNKTPNGTQKWWAHSWDDEESFFDSSLRSESLPKSNGPRSFYRNTTTALGDFGWRDLWLPVCSGTLLKEETLCSRGLRLFAVAAAVSCAVSACNCTTRPASKACSRDGCGFCCCSCRLCTSCCNCAEKSQEKSRLLRPLLLGNRNPPFWIDEMQSEVFAFNHFRY